MLFTFVFIVCVIVYIFHINTKSVLLEHIPHDRNGLIDSLRVIFNDYDTDNMNTISPCWELC